MGKYLERKLAKPFSTTSGIDCFLMWLPKYVGWVEDLIEHTCSAFGSASAPWAIISAVTYHESFVEV